MQRCGQATLPIYLVLQTFVLTIWEGVYLELPDRSITYHAGMQNFGLPFTSYWRAKKAQQKFIDVLSARINSIISVSLHSSPFASCQVVNSSTVSELLCDPSDIKRRLHYTLLLHNMSSMQSMASMSSLLVQLYIAGTIVQQFNVSAPYIIPQ